MNGHLGGTQNTLHIIALSRLAPPAKILDMGAGAGETVGLLRDMGYDARGIDIRPGSDMRRGISSAALIPMRPLTA